MRTALLAIAAASLLSACGQEKPQFYSTTVRCEVTTNTTFANEVQKPETKIITIEFGVRGDYVDYKTTKPVPYILTPKTFFKTDKEADTAYLKKTAFIGNELVIGTSEYTDEKGSRDVETVELNRVSGVITFVRNGDLRPTKNPRDWFSVRSIGTGTCVKPKAI